MTIHAFKRIVREARASLPVDARCTLHRAAKHGWFVLKSQVDAGDKTFCANTHFNWKWLRKEKVDWVEKHIRSQVVCALATIDCQAVDYIGKKL